jgi:hypothetical protein
MARLSEAQVAALRELSGIARPTWAISLKAKTTTLIALSGRGLAAYEPAKDWYATAWSITPAGRAALAEHEEAGK